MHLAHRSRAFLTACLAGSLLLGSGVTALASQTPTTNTSDAGVATLIGTLQLPNEGGSTTAYISLFDLSPFVTRDSSAPQPNQYVQPITGIDGDPGNGATFSLPLPIAPEGAMVNVSHGENDGSGVQLYSVEYNGQNMLGNDLIDAREWTGWSGWNSSLTVQDASREISGGQIVVWAPDDQQLFPTGYGPDKKLFTADDPLGPLDAGWTVIQLDAEPFALDRSTKAEITITPGLNDPLADLSGESYPDAFNHLVDLMEQTYRLTDEKQLDWEALRAKYAPEVAAAKDDLSFRAAVRAFLDEAQDSNIFGMEPIDTFIEQHAATVGLHFGQTDDGDIIVTQVDPDSAAAKAGIDAGAKLVQWDGDDPQTALEKVELLRLPASPQLERADRLRFLGRLADGATATIVYRNPGASSAEEATLTGAVDPNEPNPFQAVTFYRPWDAWVNDPGTLYFPIDAWMTPDQIGVIRLREFGDQNVSALTWEWQLDGIMHADPRGLVIDLRYLGDPGYAMAMNYAGYFSPDTYDVATESWKLDDGTLLEGATLTVHPQQMQWQGPVTLLVNEWCGNACELFVRAMQHNPNVTVVGMSSTQGNVAIPGRIILMPDGNFVGTVPAAYLDPETGDFLSNGAGITPDILVPSTVETLTATEDPVMAAAVAAILAAPAATPVP